LLRPGRFDKLLLIPIPNEAGRLKILEVHSRNMPLEGVDLASLAKRLDGYVGADIENLCREAALVALRQDKDAGKVTAKHFEEALARVRASANPETDKFYEAQASDMKTAMSKKSKDDYSPSYYR